MSWLFWTQCVLLFVKVYSSTDIVGCGGFLKSQMAIDFSKVDVKLYAKQGSLKESSDCAPTNGYYFIPLSDKGEYTLKIEPPAGWFFEPKEVPIIFDGVNDPCSLSLDINFNFKGFAVTGKVASRGSEKGPEGVTVGLKSETGQEQQSTVTGKNGAYQFAPVLPGKYVVTARSPSLQFSQNSAQITVSLGGVEVPANSLVVAGFSVTGQVFSNGEPVKGVRVLLYAVDGQNNGQPLDCDKSAVAGALPGALCHVTSDSSGVFRFAAVPSGRYRLRPYYVTFQVVPSELEFQVKLAHVTLPDKFMVKGFSVKGRVLSGPGGKGLPGVAVYLDNVKVTTTDSDGQYQLERMEPGTYTLTAKTEDLQFPNAPAKISPTTPELEPLVPSGVRVCGRVVPGPGAPAVRVQATPAGDGLAPLVIPVNRDTGRFCEFLAPGSHSLSVLLPEGDAAQGLQYLPVNKIITVGESPITNLEFSQLRATLNGRIVKLPRAVRDRSLTVKLKNRDVLVHALSLGPGDETFSFPDVQPSTYDVEVESNLQCFEPSTHRVTVNSAQVNVPGFVQTGYIIRIRSSHPTAVEVKTLKREKVKTVNLIKGENFVCLPNAGQFLFTPVGCHGYEQDELTWEVGRELPVDLTAVAHDFTGVVFTTEQVPVHVHVSSNGRLIAKLGPLSSTKLSDSSYRAEFTYRAKEGQQLELSPKAPTTVFTPETVELRGGTDCVRQAVQFAGERGLLVEGKVSPALDGVKVTMKLSPPLADVVAVTGSDGRFVFGPLKQTTRFELTAEKESYVLTGPDRSYTFQAHKLAQVRVTVKDNATAAALSGVLLSLTGGEKYRKNSITEDNGERTFHSLSPGEYFLRPMMKEYKFDPASFIIQLKAGETKVIPLTGRRVSFSVFGLVTSLNGEPEGNVGLEAVGQDSCSGQQEEGLSDNNGAYRIRGLLPQCDYVLKFKPNTKSTVYRIAPPGRIVKTSEGDVRDVRLIAFHEVDQVDLAVHVTATVPDHLKTITIKLCKEDHPESPLHVVRLDSLAGGIKNWGPQAAQERFLRGGLLVPLPFLPKDGSAYVVLAESSLSPNAHAYSEPSARFIADSPYLALQLNFHAQVRSVEQESPRHLVAGLFLAFIALLYWQLRQGWPAVTLLTNWLAARQEGSLGAADAAAAKKKGRARKT